MVFQSKQETTSISRITFWFPESSFLINMSSDSESYTNHMHLSLLICTVIRWDICQKTRQNTDQSNLSARSSDSSVIILAVPTDTCLDQQSTGPWVPAQHHDQKPQDPKAKTSPGASRACTPLITDWPIPCRPSAHTYLLYQLCQHARGTTLEKINFCWEKTKRVTGSSPGSSMSVKGEVKPFKWQHHHSTVAVKHFITDKEKMKAKDEAIQFKGTSRVNLRRELPPTTGQNHQWLLVQFTSSTTLSGLVAFSCQNKLGWRATYVINRSYILHWTEKMSPVCY